MCKYITTCLNNILKYKKIVNNDIKKNNRVNIRYILFSNNTI